MEWYKKNAPTYNEARRRKYAEARAKEGVTVKAKGAKPRRKTDPPSIPSTPTTQSQPQQVEIIREVISRAIQEELERLRQQVDELTQTLSETKQNETKLHIELAETKEKISSYQRNETKLINETTTKQNTIETLEKSLSDTKQNETKLTQTITALTAEKEQLTRDLEVEKKEREKDKTKYRGQIDEILAVNKQATEAYNIAKQHIETKDREIAQYIQQIQAKDQEIVELKRQQLSTRGPTLPPPLPTPIISQPKIEPAVQVAESPARMPTPSTLESTKKTKRGPGIVLPPGLKVPEIKHGSIAGSMEFIRFIIELRNHNPPVKCTKANLLDYIGVPNGHSNLNKTLKQNKISWPGD